MGYYNVVRPCVVGKLHYASVPAQPIEVDDEVAAPLVESGDLTRYGVFDEPLLGDGVASVVGTECIAPQLGVGFVEGFAPDEKPQRPRRPRKSAEG